MKTFISLVILVSAMFFGKVIANISQDVAKEEIVAKKEITKIEEEKTPDQVPTTVEDYLAGYITRSNSILPMQIDNVTILDSTRSEGRHVFNKYTVDTSGDNFGSNIANAGKKLVELYCGKEDVKYFRDNGIDLSWSYYSTSGKFIATYTASNADCQ